MDVSLPWKLRDWIPEEAFTKASNLRPTYLHVNPHPAIFPLILKSQWFKRNINRHDKISDLWAMIQPSLYHDVISWMIKNPQYLDWRWISVWNHPLSLKLLKERPDNIQWEFIWMNPIVFDGGFDEWFKNKLEMDEEEYIEFIEWGQLSTNPHPKAFKLMRQYPEKIDWSFLLWINTNDEKFDLLEENPDKINWFIMSQQSHPRAISLLEKNPDKINWEQLAHNTHPKAVQWLLNNEDKIECRNFIQNSNPLAIEWFKRHPEKTKWLFVFRNHNPLAFEILEKNYEKCICWDTTVEPITIVIEGKFGVEELFSNPNIFVYDYRRMEENCLIFKEELIKRMFHPRNLSKFKGWGYNDEDEDDDNN